MCSAERTEWRLVTLGDVAREVRLQELDPVRAGVERCVRGEDFEPGELRFRRWGRVPDDMGPTFTKRFRKGDLLYLTRRAYLRKAAVADFDGVCANTTLVLETDPHQLLRELLPFVVHTEAFVDYAVRASVGSTNPFVKWSDLRNFTFRLPSLERQRQVVEVLHEIEQSANEAVALAATAASVRLSLLDRAFRGVEDGKRVPMASLLLLNRAGYWGKPAGGADVDVRVIRSTEFTDDGELNLTTAAVRSLRAREAERAELRAGDVVLEKSGGGPDRPVGRVALFRDGPGYVASNFLQLLRCDTDLVLPEYLFQRLWYEHAIGLTRRFQARTTGIRNLSVGRYLAREISVPKINVQQQLVQRTSQSAAMEQAATSHAQELRAVRGALLTKLITDPRTQAELGVRGA